MKEQFVGWKERQEFLQRMEGVSEGCSEGGSEGGQKWGREEAVESDSDLALPSQKKRTVSDLVITWKSY